MLVSRHRYHFSKVTIFLLVSWFWNCQGLSKWQNGQENPLLKGYYSGALKLHNLLKALSVEDVPENYLDLYNDVAAIESEDIDDTKPALSLFWEGMKTDGDRDNIFGEKEMVAKRNDLNSICRKGNVFGSWLVRLCNDRRSVR
ncbi:uncharacterized protein LOC132716998 [Ruditapes philippinarum]|uniref:uncharacterized protein LOC132716998 n=1 Tax=Ruditapes philippinarum TaxID=129788 RepID=UPI00295BED08|nr:uncharacterized protein LOC132716998 [Ruditapes philippinarum]